MSSGSSLYLCCAHTQLRPTLWSSMLLYSRDFSGSSSKRVAISSSEDLLKPRIESASPLSLVLQAGSLPAEHLGSPPPPISTLQKYVIQEFESYQQGFHFSTRKSSLVNYKSPTKISSRHI